MSLLSKFRADHLPIAAVALVFAAPAVGDRPIPGGGGELQVVHVVCVSAIAVTGLWVLAGRLPIRSALRRPEIRPPLWFGAGLVAAAAASTSMAADPVRGLKVTATYAAGWLVLLAILLVAKSLGRLRTLVGAAVVGSLAVTLPILSQAERLKPVYGGAVVRNRAQSIFADPNQFGCYAALIVLLAVGWFLAASQRWERVLAVAGGSGALAALVLSLSRGAWLGTAAGLVTVAVLHPGVRRALVAAVAVSATLLAAGLLVSLTAPAEVRGGPAAGLVEVVVDRLAVIDDRAANPHDVRPITWREAVRQFRERPVLGNGPGSFSRLAAESPSVLQFAPRLHAHNVLLQLGAETGVVGLAAGVSFAGSCGLAALAAARELRRRADGRTLGLVAGATGALVALSVHLMVDYPIRNPVLMIFAWSVAALLLAAHAGVCRQEPASAGHLTLTSRQTADA
ncbi:O-antigen ligase family protein [Cryptosporangium phraense]|uniref:O-antigen ligase family protein n=1 Tax=Cryptosporangium phraense TaxID=2593070 RepID=A0A545AY64_9ACTN|nr:O-antigen ligase family protein [Cryptosporangium phraense]TQS45505.1 O-antigen ligase family protein [Cryptosporangium phraense]